MEVIIVVLAMTCRKMQIDMKVQNRLHQIPSLPCPIHADRWDRGLDYGRRNVVLPGGGTRTINAWM